jgi:hypothetical protein
MLKMRLSATEIDSLRYYLANEDGDLDALIAQLRRQTPPTEAMMAGAALHAALEVAQPGEYRVLQANGFAFEMPDAEIDLPAFREIKATRDYFLGDVCVTLVGKVDAVHGRRVDDHKFTSRFDPDRFLNSYQWRVYLEIFEADEFRWNVFEGTESQPRHYFIRHVHPLRMYRYPGMIDDVEREVGKFIDFAREHLPERLTPREPEAWEYLAVG